MVHPYQRTLYTHGRGSLQRQRASFERSAIHDLNGRSGAGVLLIATDTRRILLAKRGLAGAYPSTWAPFGGMVDPGEVPIEAALRELQEEAGVALSPESPNLIREHVFVDTITSRDKAARPFSFYTFAYLSDFEPQVTLNAESAGYGWFTQDEAAALLLHPGFTRLLQSPAGELLSKYL